MKKSHKILILLTIIATFLLIHQPHVSYPMPYHIDEWHHISEAIRMGNYGEYFEVLRLESANKFSGLEMGFHLFLFLLSFGFNLVSIYQFLPALWASLSALVLFYVTYKKTNHNFFIAWLAMIFFISIRSNVNLTGLWFFTPLTFATPLIFLYIYFLTEGIEKQNKKNILIGLAIMLFLIPTHSISILFIIPALIIYLLINYKYIIKEYLFFSLFLIFPIIGIIFFKYTFAIDWSGIWPRLWEAIQFKHGWGVLEIKNNFTEVYHWLGYVLAIIGVLFIIFSHNLKKYSFYIIWPLTTIAMIIIYRLSGISFLSPYQRNLYYLSISLPLLSAVGLYGLLQSLQSKLKKILTNSSGEKISIIRIKIDIDQRYAELVQKIIIGSTTGLILIISFSLIFINYYNLPPQVSLYKVIEKRHYNALKFIADYPSATVMATPFVSTALYPITGHQPVGSVSFYGNKQIVEEFFISADCDRKKTILQEQNVKYVISPINISCGWESIYNQDGNYIYELNI